MPTLEEVESKLIFKCISGSHAYGLQRPDSDTDLRGCFPLPIEHYLRITDAFDQISDSNNDTTYYSLKRLLKLLTESNPNCLEYLFMPDDCVLITSEAWQTLLDNRHLFISKRALQSYAGYAVAQIKKAKGQNKLSMNPMAEQKPMKEDFCWLISPFQLSGQRIDRLNGACRPVKLTETGIDLSEYHCSGLEHGINMFRLYHYGKDAKGVFRGEADSAMVVTESIPIEDEDKFSGLLLYHQDAYERELRVWHNYWDWEKNRNKSRWNDEQQVDSKNISHCMRLLYEGENILDYGHPIVRFTGEKLQHLRNIREGKVKLNDIISEAEERLKLLDDKRRTCDLPATANMKVLGNLSIKLHIQLEYWWDS